MRQTCHGFLLFIVINKYCGQHEVCLIEIRFELRTYQSYYKLLFLFTLVLLAFVTVLMMFQTDRLSI